MRIFGKFLQTFQLSRSLSCSTTTRRYSSSVCCPPFKQNPQPVRNYTSSRPFGSKSGNSKFINRNLGRHSGKKSNKGNEDGAETVSTKDNTTNISNNSDSPCNILPVALIKSSSHNIKILLIPINLFEGDDEAAQKTLATISIIRDNAKQIEAFAENATMDPYFPNTTNFSLPIAKDITTNNSKLESENLTPEVKDEDDDLEFWQNELASEKALRDDNALYDGLEQAVAKQDIERVQSENAFDVIAWNDSKRHLFAYIPESLEAKLNKMAIASMHLAFEMNMTNIRDAILMGPGSNNIDLYNVPPPKSLKDPTLCLTTCLDMSPYQQQTMVPLHFNALIQGTVEIDSSKISHEQLREIKIPEFNDYMTTIAAHICSSALQKGFPADISRMSYSTKSTSNTNSSSQNYNPHIVCLREGDKGCISSSNVDYPMFSPLRSGSSSADSTSRNCLSASAQGGITRKASSGNSDSRGNDVPLLLSSAIIGDCGARGLMSCNAYAKALVEAAKRREAMKGDNSKKDCKKTPKAEVKADVKAKVKEEDNKSCKEQLKEDPCKADTKEEKKPACKKSCEDNKESRSSKSSCDKPKEKKVCNSAAEPEKEPSKDKPKCEDPKPPKCTPHEPKLPCGPPNEEPAKPNKNCSSQKAAPKTDTCDKEKKDTKPRCPSKDAKDSSCEKKCETPKPMSTSSTSSSSANRNPHIVCVREGDKGCVSPGNVDYPKFSPPGSGSSKAVAGISSCDTKKASSKKDKDKGKCILPDPCKDECNPEPPKKKEKPCPVEEPPCKKIKSPCKGPGGSDKCKKPDPKSCKSESTGSMSLSKKDDKCSKKPEEKKDTCKEKDPCKEKKPDPCKDKAPCKSKKPDKKDKCAAPKKDDKCGDKKKEDKCATDKKEDKCGGGKKEEKKKDKCGAEKKQDKCASDKKKDKCGGDKKEEKKKDKCGAEKKKDKCGTEKKKDKCNAGKKEEKKEDKCGAEKKKDKCASDKKDEKKQDKCASDKKDEKKQDKCASDEKKKDPCNPPEQKKLESAKCNTEDPCKSKSKCGGEAKKEKADPCKKVAAKKDDKGCGEKPKDTKPVCKTDSKSASKKAKNGNKCDSKSDDPCKPIKKCFSTSSIVGWNLDLFGSNKRNFSTSTFSSLRSFSSKKKKNDESDGKCSTGKSKMPKNRKNVKRQENPDCFSEAEDQCGTKSCKDPKLSSCGDKEKNKKENKNSTPWGIFITTCTTTFNTKKVLTSQLLYRYFGTSAVYTTRFTINQDDDDECDHGRSDYHSDIQNEVVKIIDACTVERVCENVPNFSDYDVLIRTAAVAISGSDIHVYETGGKACPGMTIGHDASGIIEKVGKCIYCLKPGDRVAIESGLSCGICDFCKRGAYNMCSQLIYNGFLSTFQVHPADLCHKIPNNLTMEEGSMTQTLALGCQACFKAHITPTTNVLVVGSSATAISAALCARAIGAKRVCITSSMQDALEASRELYGLDCVHYDCSMNFGEALEGIFCVMNDWPDVVINCSISETTMNLAVMALQPCGRCILAECEAECACFNALDVLMKNLSLVPSFRSTNMFPTALQLMQSGRAPICQLIARVFGWQQVANAFRSAQHESNVGNRKVIVKCAEEENSKEAKT